MPAEAVSLDALRQSLGLLAQGRVILCGGELTRQSGIKDAIWAADILKFLYDDLCLLIAGDGPERPRLVQFARDIRVSDRVRFLGRRKDLARLVQVADLVWVLGRPAAAPPLVHEALAAGVPLVASDIPVLAALVAHGRSGLLVPPGDTAALARASRILLEDAAARFRCRGTNLAALDSRS